MASKQFLTLEDAVKVALELMISWNIAFEEGDEECLRNEFEQKCYSANNQYAIGWDDGMKAGIDALKTLYDRCNDDGEMNEEKKFIDADRIDWRLIIPTNVTIAEENMIHLAKKLVERQPAADVVEKSKYDKLKAKYDRLLENANYLAEAVRKYQKREEEEHGN